MYCPRCGAQNTENASTCVACGNVLAVGAPVQVKISGLAIAALALGILSLFTCGLTAFPAIIVGIIALVVIGQSGGRLTGKGFAVTGIAIPALVLFLAFTIVWPTLVRIRQLAIRATCGTNLSGIGRTMWLYSNDYQNRLPVAGGPGSTWGAVANWTATNRQDAFGLTADSTGGKATISSCLYLLVKYAQVPPRSFVCWSDSGTTVFSLSALGGVSPESKLVSGWDFGPPGESWRHCSYAYHIPFGHRPLIVSAAPGFVVAADRNPFLASPSGGAAPLTCFRPDLPDCGGTADQAKAGNALAHQRDGQNVMYLDTHVSFEKRAYCGIENDNIYLISPDAAKGSPTGNVPQPPTVTPAGPKDSVLVHDPDRFEGQ
jgi:hypothetical protein